MNKAWKTELGWIAALLGVALLVDFLLFEKLSIFQSTVDVQLHSTYFVLPGFLLFASLFILLAVPVYLAKEVRWRFSRFTPNLMAGILLLLLLLSVFYWHSVTHYLIGGWIVYPPLSSEAMQDFSPPSYRLWNKVYIGIEIVLIAGLLWLGFRTRKLAG